MSKKTSSDLRFEMLNFIVENRFRKMSVQQQAAIMVLYQQAGKQRLRRVYGIDAFQVSHFELAEYMGVSRKWAKKVMASLLDDGYIELVQEKYGNTPRIYQLAFRGSRPKPPADPQKRAVEIRHAAKARTKAANRVGNDQSPRSASA